MKSAGDNIILYNVILVQVTILAMRLKGGCQSGAYASSFPVSVPGYIEEIHFILTASKRD